MCADDTATLSRGASIGESGRRAQLATDIIASWNPNGKCGLLQLERMSKLSSYPSAPATRPARASRRWLALKERWELLSVSEPVTSPATKVVVLLRWAAGRKAGHPNCSTATHDWQELGTGRTPAQGSNNGCWMWSTGSCEPPPERSRGVRSRHRLVSLWRRWDAHCPLPITNLRWF